MAFNLYHFIYFSDSGKTCEIFAVAIVYAYLDGGTRIF